MPFDTGSNSIPAGVTTLTVNFQTDFGGAAPDVVIPTVENTVDVGATIIHAQVTAVTPSSFTVELDNTTGAFNNYRLDWIAGTNKQIFEVASSLLVKIQDLPLFTGQFTDDDLFPFVNLDPLPKTFVTNYAKLISSSVKFVDTVPVSPTDPVGDDGPAFAMDENYLYTKYAGSGGARWGRQLRQLTEQEWNNAQIKKGQLELGVNSPNQWNPLEFFDYSNGGANDLEEIYIYFQSSASAAFKPPDPSFDLAGSDPQVLISFKGSNSLSQDNLDLIGGNVTEVSLTTPPVSPPAQFPVPPTYEGHFKVTLTSPLLIDRTTEVPPAGISTYCMTWEAIQMLS